NLVRIRPYCGCLIAILIACVGCHESRKSPTPIRVLDNSGPVASLAFSPDGETLAVGSTAISGQLWNGEVKCWETKTHREVTLQQFEQWVNAVAFSPDGKLFAVACGRFNDTKTPEYAGYRSLPGRIYVYDRPSFRFAQTLPHSHGVYTLAF